MRGISVAIIFSLLGSLVHAQSTVVAKPEPLVQAELARSHITTARIDWSAQYLFEDSGAKERVHFYTWRCAGPDCVQERWGDDEGVFMRGESQQPLASKFQNPEFALTKDGQVWHHEGRSPIARVWNDRDRLKLFDFRAIGLNPADLYDDLFKKAAALGIAVVCESDTDAGVFRVRAHTVYGDYLWWIDDQRDWNIVRTRIVGVDGETKAETVYELKKFDGRWFPSVMRHYRGSADGGELFWMFRVIAAEFNRPEHPSVLSPAFIGIEPGMALQYMDRDSPVPSPVWDGSAVVSYGEFISRIQAGQAAFGPTLLREQARIRAHWERTVAAQAAAAKGGVAWKSFESAWERYTREFIGRYKLNDEQSQHAWTLCRECQNQAREYVERHRERFDKLDREPTDGLRTELISPIDAIFEKKLKPRLEDIPNSAQRAAAEAENAKPIAEPAPLATSQPSMP